VSIEDVIRERLKNNNVDRATIDAMTNLFYAIKDYPNVFVLSQDEINSLVNKKFVENSIYQVPVDYSCLYSSSLVRKNIPIEAMTIKLGDRNLIFGVKESFDNSEKKCIKAGYYLGAFPNTYSIAEVLGKEPNALSAAQANADATQLALILHLIPCGSGADQIANTNSKWV